MAAALLETVRVEALFVSDVQDTDQLTEDAVRKAVLSSVRRYGTRGCADMVAAEFDRHPDDAEPRMTWVRDTIRSMYPCPGTTPPRRPSPSPIAA